MTNEELLHELSEKVRSGQLSQETVLARISSTSAQKDTSESKKGYSSRMLYYIGGIIIAIGLTIFVGEIWEDIGSVGRILVTLGLGLMLTLLGSVIVIKKKDSLGILPDVFNGVGGILIVSGVVVTIQELGISMRTALPYVIGFLLVALFYGILSFVHKRVMLTFLAMCATTLFIFALFSYSTRSLQLSTEWGAYFFTVLGISYLLLAKSFEHSWNARIIPLTLFAGSTFIFCSLGYLVGNGSHEGAWELLYAPLLAGGFYLAAYFKSKTLVVTSTIALLSYVVYITAQYFAEALGWSLSLVFLGFVFIGLGYASLAFNKKYVQKTQL